MKYDVLVGGLASNGRAQGLGCNPQLSSHISTSVLVYVVTELGSRSPQFQGCNMFLNQAYCTYTFSRDFIVRLYIIFDMALGLLEHLQLVILFLIYVDACLLYFYNHLGKNNLSQLETAFTAPSSEQ